MSDNYFIKKANEYLQHINDCACDADKQRALVMLAKDVERDTRHRASDIANNTANEISNMRWDKQ